MTRVEERLSELLHADQSIDVSIEVGEVVALADRRHKQRVTASIAAAVIAVAAAVVVPVSLAGSGTDHDSVTIGGVRMFGSAIIQPKGIYIDKAAKETFVPPSEAQLAAANIIAPMVFVRRFARLSNSSVKSVLSANYLYIGDWGTGFEADNAPSYGLRSKQVFECPPGSAIGAPPADPLSRCVGWRFFSAINHQFVDSTYQQLPDAPAPGPTTS